MYQLLLCLAFLLFLALSTYQITLPGINYDEVLDAVPAMQALQGQPVDAAASIRLAGREVPLMVMPYISATSSYWFMPFFATLGVSVISLRLATIVLAALTLLLLWGFLREFFDEQVASLSVLLLAVNPTYIFWSRMGAYVAWPLLPLFIATLWALWRWYRTGSTRALLLAAACAGFGVNSKILFLWVIVALGLTWLLLSPWLGDEQGVRRWLWPLQRATVGRWVAAGVAALLGTSMMLVYNLRTGGATARLIYANSRSTQLYGVNNLDLPSNLRIVFLEDFRLLLDGGWFKDIIGGHHSNPLAIIVFLVATVLLVSLMRHQYLANPTRLAPMDERSRPDGARQADSLGASGIKIAFLYILLLAIVAQSAVTITNLGANHLLLVLWIPATLISIAAVHRVPRPQRWVTAGAGLALAGLLLSDLTTTIAYHQTLRRTGGVDYFSDAIYQLAADLEQADAVQPVVMDWGFKRNLQFLSQNHLNIEERFGYSNSPDAALVDAINARVQQGPSLYLFHTPEQSAFDGHWELFEEAAYRHRLTPVLWRSYASRTGEPLYRVYQLMPMTPRFGPPTPAVPTDIVLDGTIALLGYDGQAAFPSDGDPLRLTLYWQGRTAIARSYKVFAHLLDEQGSTVAQSDWMPMLWGYPTTAWQPGEIVADRLIVPAPNDLPPGRYRLYIGMYDAETGQRLPVMQAGLLQPGDTVELLAIETQEK